MIADLSFSVYLVFFGALLFAILLFYVASGKDNKVLLFIILIGTGHSILAINGFYQNSQAIPPRLFLVILPMLLIIFFSVFSKRMKVWLSSLDLKHLTYLHTTRLPVELVLYWLFLAGYVPELMTFEGGNLDILIGVGSPLVGWFAFGRKQINRKLLWIWNVSSIILLTNIVVRAALSVPTVLQQLAFDQPNTGILYFPFILLPGVIVPLVLISNMAGFIILAKQEGTEGHFGTEVV